MSKKKKLSSDALLDGLVFARDILWILGLSPHLSLLEQRLKGRYDIVLWDLRSPVESDNSNSSPKEP